MTIGIKNLDHLVITANNLQATIDFYTKVLGMEHVAFGDNLHSVHFGDQKFNIHDASTNVSPKAKNIVPGSEDFCLISETSVSQVIQHLQDCGVTVGQGPVTRSGAAGALQSVYFRDPDGNLVEVSNVIG
jgi:catechol 2,3-dioxygenase-like lactoylglutathione lyase family enzyme